MTTTTKPFRTTGSILLLAALLACPGHLFAQSPPPAAETPEAPYRIFDARGRAATLEDILDASGTADVLLVGEMHDDATAHRVEAELLRGAFARYARKTEGKRPRSVVLSLEMFERDVQTILDEYLAGLINERHFLASSRPWNNYGTDYRPLVEFAREHEFGVIAANAPARYVNRVARLGPKSLKALPAAAAAWLPPLPYPSASERYAAKCARFMRGGMEAPEARQAQNSTGEGATPQQQTPAPNTPNPHAPQAGHAGASFLVDAQALRDASMAYAITERLRQKPGALVLHVNGRFHSEEHLGVPEQIKLYRPAARLLVITIASGEGYPAFDAGRLGTLGDFVVLTDPALPRSF
ncbi:MAG TPA: ChaN family lipoprotein [Pyrinomonadaceae bacterium]|nr:ChaN family lipoprotein [Pyrinomonadaceae bacterium]